MIRRAKEGEITWMQGVLASDIPRLPNGISLHLRRGELGIEAQNVVGAIPLLNGDTLQIVPKIGQMNFLRLLFKAEGFQRDLEREFADFVSYSVEDEENVDSLVARQLMYAADHIMNRSAQQGRVKQRREGVFATGQMNVVATALNIAIRKQEPVVCFVRERTWDIPENRVLSEAIVRASFVLNEAERAKFDWIKERWLRKFTRSEDIEADLARIEEGFASGRYGGPRDYYRRALMLAQIVLGSSGLGFAEIATVEGDAILLNTADIFERYLRNVISEAYSQAGYVVTKGGAGVKSLYTDGSFELVPDIAISRDGRLRLIADAKYKQPTSGDHYQMHTYLFVNGIARGLILAPLYEGGEVRLREYSTTENIVVREAYLPMNNLPATEAFLGTIVEKYS
jgi:5-methylcytosine-specific restriction endonuclease McrBC regulatory subunit McrC